jgi:hypothetical protein
VVDAGATDFSSTQTTDSTAEACGSDDTGLHE